MSQLFHVYHLHFNPHSRKGSDSFSFSGSRSSTDFNPHSRKGSDAGVGLTQKAPVIFQSTLPQREWLNCGFCRVSPGNFNPHSRKGSDIVKMDCGKIIKISIHTPAKGVTLLLRWYNASIRISIHTPAKGVTSGCVPASHRIGISIHTPAKGVTNAFIAVCELIVFQSTLPQREWPE